MSGDCVAERLAVSDPLTPAPDADVGVTRLLGERFGTPAPRAAPVDGRFERWHRIVKILMSGLEDPVLDLVTACAGPA